MFATQLEENDEKKQLNGTYTEANLLSLKMF